MDEMDNAKKLAQQMKEAEHEVPMLRNAVQNAKNEISE
jgi:hypothetical protein